MLRDLLMILFVTCSTLGSQLLIKSAVVRIAALDPAPVGLHWLSAVVASPKIWIAVAVQGVGFLVWIAVVSRVKLGPAFATSGAFFYVLLAMVSCWLYGERLPPLQWVGVVMVTIGVVLISLSGTHA